MRTLLKHFTKSASVPYMEASFNSDYDLLLLTAEDYAREEARKAYTEIFGLIMTQPEGDISGETRLVISGIIQGLTQRIYSKVNELYNPWYTESFGHLSSLSTEQIGAVYGNTPENLAASRAEIITQRVTDTISKNVPDSLSIDSELEKKIEFLSNRFAITETNSAAGAVINQTAIAAFGTSSLFKRWISVGDERVRYTHRAVSQNKPIPIDRLYRVGDTYMRYPADTQAFGGNPAAETINCRCRSLVLPRTLTQQNSSSLNTFLGL